MKRVEDIAAVAHNWANRIGENAKASNLFFINDNIYSYGHHFLIAKHVQNESGQSAVLFTCRGYSVSTSAHINLVRNAARHLKIIYVPNPELWENELFENWYRQIKNIAIDLERARKPAKYIFEIQRVFSEAKCYADFFGYEIPEILRKAS